MVATALVRHEEPGVQPGSHRHRGLHHPEPDGNAVHTDRHSFRNRRTLLGQEGMLAGVCDFRGDCHIFLLAGKNGLFAHNLCRQPFFSDKNKEQIQMARSHFFDHLCLYRLQNQRNHPYPRQYRSSGGKNGHCADKQQRSTRFQQHRRSHLHVGEHLETHQAAPFFRMGARVVQDQMV